MSLSTYTERTNDMTVSTDKVIFESKITVADLLELVNYMSDSEETTINEDLCMILETQLSDAVLNIVSEFIQDYL
jgi:hypothetical protein